MFLKPSTRPENEIFKDLSELCTKPGFIHVIATLCFRDTVVGYKDEILKANALASPFYHVDILIECVAMACYHCD